MAAPSGSGDSPVNNYNIANNAGANADLLHSLNKLSLSATDSRSPSRSSSTSPNPAARALSRLDRLAIASSPSRTSAPRSPSALSVSSPHARSVSSPYAQSPSRSGTPSLLRKSSTSSLRSANGTTPNHASSRRSSSALLSPAGARTSIYGTSPNILEVEERSQKTENSVAQEYFARELLYHHISDDAPAPKSETLVILQDACYKHRFQRPFTGKGNLGTIVERPERLQAVYTGVAMAYVRLGERHEDGRTPIGADADPSTMQVPFDIRKTDRKIPLDSPVVTNVHGARWMEELLMICGSAKSKLDAGTLEIERPDIDRGHGAKDPTPFHRGDLYLSPESLSAFEGAIGATCEAVDAVFSDSATKRAFVAVRPPGHHCDASFPHGFCWLNNVQVGIMHGFMNHGLTHAAIIDFDLHHGDGSQDITWDYNYRKHWAKGNAAQWKKNSIGYFSVHDIQSYPCEQGDQDTVKKASLCIEDAFSQTIWNVHLQQWKDHTDFWFQYRTRIVAVLDKARAYLRREADKFRAAGQEPKAVIFFSAGFDASEFESPGMQRHHVNVPTEFYARISRDVVKMSFEEGLAVDGRIVSCLEGGYSDRALYSGVLSHLSGLAGGDVRAKEDAAGGLNRSGSHRRIGSTASPLSRRSTLSSSDSDARSKVAGFPYESSWWTASELDRLDAVRAAPVVQPRIVRNVATPTYCSPTQSSNAKVSELAKARRTVSGFSSPSAVQQTYIRAPSPPPPAVYWPIASLELSRLLIPSDSQVASFTWEEMKIEETRIKKEQKEQKERERLERLGVSSSPIDGEIDMSNVPVVRKSGRERKPVSYTEPEDPNKNRRRTVAGAAVIATDKATARGIPTNAGAKHTRLPSRRLSASSAMSIAIVDAAIPPPPAETFTSFDAFERPGTAQTVRPDSSLSMRTTTGPVPVKKTRPTAVRKDSNKSATTSARKPRTTAPKAASKTKVKDSTATATSSRRSSRPSSPAHAKHAGEGPGPSNGESSAAPPDGNDLAGITNGMKKIKINIITKEMKEARNKVAKDKDSAISTPATEQPTQFPITPKAEEEEATTPPQPSQDLRATLPPAALQQPEPIPLVPNKETELPSRQPTPIASADLTLSPGTPAVSVPQDSHLFIPYQPEGATPQPLPQTAPTKWMAPNTIETPTGFRGHNFTATSAIPFSPAKRQHVSTPMPAGGRYLPQMSQQAVFAGDFIPSPEKEASDDFHAASDFKGEMTPQTRADNRTYHPSTEIPETPGNRF
ncbi:histone deacetylase domain-containing protein [Truncatella angustata]|uniref:Histone deacetylase domain-containing protein n=1 Tax=Truncatella angustata TaxID=152316 RepID=A0A9P8UW70_9PEZI|nr:histone deacetylase domain-containing protein [Truncatella angustata]KAH6659129.1 histone deacetylase domain-containing protein [Truncatella angustata]